MMERAAVPPRTIKKVSDLFWAATFILDFFWGEIQPQKTIILNFPIYHWNPLRGLVAEGVGLISASGLHPCGAAFGSLCRFASLELRKC
jgi:hypothetical protein